MRRPEISIIIPHRGNRDFRPLITLESDFVELIPVFYPHSIWNISRATNIGIKKARGRIIVKADADILISESFIDDVLCAGDCFCVAPARFQIERKPVEAAWDQPIWANLSSWYWPCGAWQSAPRDFWFDLRGYDEDMLVYGAEDTDMWNRAHDSGIPVMILNPIVHRWHESRRNNQGFFHGGNAKLRELRRGLLKRNPSGWGKEPPTIGRELARWLLNTTKETANIRDGSVGGID